VGWQGIIESRGDDLDTEPRVVGTTQYGVEGVDDIIATVSGHCDGGRRD